MKVNRNKILKDYVKAFIRKNITGIKAVIFLELLPHGIAKKINLLGDSGGVLPLLYNKDGEKMYMIYMADQNVKYSFIAGRSPKYLLWNHSDKTLSVHFYSHMSIMEAKKDKKVKVKCLYLHESRAIIPKAYEYVLKHKEIGDLFDYIFTSDKEILTKYHNAKFWPASGLWYGTDTWGGVLHAERYQMKRKNISILSTYKRRCKLHQFRYELAHYYKNKSYVDTYGTFDGGAYIDLCEALDDYRYSIVIENEQSPYYFTEKILNCFAAMTIPIYVGATEIDKFFNIDGIIEVKEANIASIENAVKCCNEEDYQSRINAVIDNFLRVQNYLCPEDYIYKHYKKELFIDSNM